MIVNCQKCGTITIHRHCDDDEHYRHLCQNDCNDENCDNYSNNEENSNSPCISNHDDDDYDWFICPNCGSYHVACDRCMQNGDLQLCRFIGHSGAFVSNNKDFFRYRLPERVLKGYNTFEQDVVTEQDPKTYQLLDEDQIKRYVQDYDNKDDYPYYYVGDYDIYYLDPKQIYPTGPDGGFGNDWKCPKCQYKLSCTDK